MYILVEGGELLERRIRTDPPALPTCWARAHPPRGLDGERGGRPVFGRPRPPRRWAPPERRPHVPPPPSQGEARAPRCPCPGRALSVGGSRPARRLSDAQRHVRARLTVRRSSSERYRLEPRPTSS